jgi:hypothetical protein
MTELMLILAVIFVAYVMYGAKEEPQTTSHSPINPAKPDKPVPVAAVKPGTSQSISKTEKVPANKPVAAAKTAKPAPAIQSKPATANKAKSAIVPQNSGKQGLKDPKTGDISTNYNHYRFTKRWIKEALVAEGLLDKVYKNDELNADIETKIKSAVVKLEAIDKYRA